MNNINPNEKDLLELEKLYNLKDFINIEKKIKEIIKNFPNYFPLINLLAISLAEQNKLNDAVKFFEKAIALNPNYAEAYNNLGTVMQKLNNLNQSIFHYKKAIEKKPNLFNAYLNLGHAYKMDGKIQEAISIYKQVIELNPNYAEAYNNLGNIFSFQNNEKEAISNFDKSIRINKNFSQPYNNKGILLQKMGKLDEALACYKAAIKIDPNSADAQNNLGNLFYNICNNEEAIKQYEKASKIKPNEIRFVLNNLLLIPPIMPSADNIKFYRKRYLHGLNSLSKYTATINETDKSGVLRSFNLAYHGKDNLKIVKKTSKIFRKIFPNINYTSDKLNKKIDNRKIKIGIISQFLTGHTIGKLYRGLIKNLDRKKFEVIIFHTAQTESNAMKNEIDLNADKVINLSLYIDKQRSQIEDENLDIIFYPDIGMSTTTYVLAYSRLAPIQIVGWGHPDTTGISTIDYFLSSILLEKPNAKKKYSEKLILLKHLPHFYEPIEKFDSFKSREELGLPKTGRLYCCVQTLYKIHPDFDYILNKIVQKDPKGTIIFIGGKGKFKYWQNVLRKRWKKRFKSLNEKVIFIDPLSVKDFVALCKNSDVLLDSVHFGGGNTFLEAMIVGTPTITMTGDFLRANTTAGGYKQMKISNPPIVCNKEQYIKLAVELAKNSKKNKNLRKISIVAAKKFLFKNIFALKEFEKFLEKAHKANYLGKKLKSGYIVN